ncbi:antitrypsin-like [Formica exsecta]|uniref:antitrypsin-like n=1 Tax=Formica exsecta TaxID=72781 RepID=UPI001141D469|nr:antitrypsin-like [Formica exsecta]
MRTVLFAIIIANIVCTFDALMFLDQIFNSVTDENIIANVSTAVVTYVELKDVSSLKEPSYINQYIEDNKAFCNINIKMITTLLANGAEEGSTMNELMSFSNIADKISLNDRYLSEFTFLNSIRNIELYVGTAIYVQNSVDVTADFSSKCINTLHCSISKIDFRNDMQAAEIINSWVQKTTNFQLLDVISPENIDENTKIMLVNTVYFNIRWPYVRGKIVNRIFHVSPSEMIEVPTIKFEKSMFICGEIPHWNIKFIEIPSLNNKITMFIFLPNKETVPRNLEYLIEKFNFEEFKSIRNTYSFEQATELYLPKFTIYQTNNMTNLFRENGVITMFEDKADFTRLSKIPLKVSNIAQKIFVRVRKESSETLEDFKRGERKLVDPPQEFILDRPFLYLIEINGKMEFIAAVRKADLVIKRREL